LNSKSASDPTVSFVSLELLAERPRDDEDVALQVVLLVRVHHVADRAGLVVVEVTLGRLHRECFGDFADGHGELLERVAELG
jgi:hypothetical protein